MAPENRRFSVQSSISQRLYSHRSGEGSHEAQHGNNWQIITQISLSKTRLFYEKWTCFHWKKITQHQVNIPVWTHSGTMWVHCGLAQTPNTNPMWPPVVWQGSGGLYPFGAPLEVSLMWKKEGKRQDIKCSECDAYLEWRITHFMTDAYVSWLEFWSFSRQQ